MSWGWIAFWIWAGGYPFFVLPIARFLLGEMGSGSRVERADLFFASAFALLSALFWPLALPIMFVMSRLRAEARQYRRYQR